MLHIEVVYCGKYQQVLKAITVKTGTTILQAIRLSGIQHDFMELDLSTAKVGVFSKIVALDYKLHDNDRIEIYRELYQTPMQARIARAKKR